MPALEMEMLCCSMAYKIVIYRSRVCYVAAMESRGLAYSDCLVYFCWAQYTEDNTKQKLQGC